VKGRFERILSLFIKDQSRVDRYFRVYIHHRNLYIKGSCEVSFFKALVSVHPLMIWWLFFKSIYPDLPSSLIYIGIPIIVVTKLASNWIVGWYWETYKIFDKESDWQNDRNPVMKGMETKVLNAVPK
jgi:hypothetical protein